MSYFDNLTTFIRIYELGSMSAAARDQRISPAVASARLAQLESRLGVRLFQRTTRRLSATEQGRLFYAGACKILDAVTEAEGDIGEVTANPRGDLLVAAPLWLGRRMIAPHVPAFRAAYPLVHVRLRLSDRRLDLTAEGLDLAFHVGHAEDSDLRIRKVAECRRALCAAPSYVAAYGRPANGDEIARGRHACLNLRFPGATEFRWTLRGAEGPETFEVSGPFECDDGDVLTDWALDGHGIALKPVFEIAAHLRSGALVEVCTETPPLPVQVSVLYTHRRHQDPKARLFMDFMIQRLRADLNADPMEELAAADGRAAADQDPR
ncbi:LysR family transcriptional regulator [Jannaschia sp. S6380]|uniref:LysR family transcriptional regulator n=1 Tax=Jannaschia sp. S6380 TaxID=2926408 RepID=UPI001FF6EF16|nr:LysR family transcriptional regulator [Jannaschia sp. S6380]MCK0167236.1 LysR family transcriptional regulator [Jannaschia sp. S6380]